MRGYFGIGVECVSKSMNVGSLFRSAHAFGASFVFTIDAQYNLLKGHKVDTSEATNHLPFYSFPDPESLVLPSRCDIVGVELVDEAEELPSFRHPHQAAYILGPERGSLSPFVLKRSVYTVKIPTKFCVNVGIAGAITMYDRLISLGKFPRRPVSPGGPVELLSEHKFAPPKLQKNMAPFRRAAPLAEVEEYLKLVDEE